MASGGGLQMVGIILGILGFIGNIVTCALPNWRVTAFIGSNIVTAQSIWEGLWMNCVFQSTGQTQCKVYDSMLILSPDLQAARAMVVIALVFGLFGILLSIIGGKCSTLVEDEGAKSKVAITSGVIFIISGILILVPVCWTANSIIRDFYNPLLMDGQKMELGHSLFVGWASCAFLFIGGGLLCSSCPPKEENYNVKYSQAKSVASSKAYV